MNSLKSTLIVFMLITQVPLFAQISYDSGYIVDKSGRKTNCLIRNDEWKNTPSRILYKLTESGEIIEGKPDEVNEFMIGNTTKYISRLVTFDTSYNGFEVAELPRVRSAPRVKKLIFLKVLVEGKATLCAYTTEIYTRFFISMDSGPLSELIFRKYLLEDRTIAQNAMFRQDLLAKFTCHDIRESDLATLEYEERPMVSLFEKYNRCMNAPFINYKARSPKRKLLRINIRPGLNLYNFKIRDYMSGTTVSFGNKVSFRLGLEGEIGLPYNGNKWRILVEPSLEFYSSQPNSQSLAKIQVLKINTGVRHYFFINRASAVFLNGLIAASPILGSNVYREVDRGEKLTNMLRPSIAFGAGIKLGQETAVELRYNVPGNTLGYYGSLASRFGGFSLIGSLQL